VENKAIFGCVKVLLNRFMNYDEMEEEVESMLNTEWLKKLESKEINSCWLHSSQKMYIGNLVEDIIIAISNAS
jgi:hypothetical protein